MGTASDGLWWRPVTASVRGARHVRRGLPNEDYVAASAAGLTAAIAVADGHGDSRCPRARTGAQFAAESAVSALAGIDSTRLLGESPETVRALVAEEITPAIWTAWQEQVLADHRARPFGLEELTAIGATGEADLTIDVLRAYGTTLVAAAVVSGWLLGLQIGDGALGTVTSAGLAGEPLSAGPEHGGTATASLAGGDLSVARVCALPAARDVIAVWVCTDGFSGAQFDPDWRAQVATQIAQELATTGPERIATELARWLSPAAATAGDDTTMAMLLVSRPEQSPASPGDRPLGRASRLGESTVPPATLPLRAPSSIRQLGRRLRARRDGAGPSDD